MNAKAKAEALRQVYNNLGWDDYIFLVDNIAKIDKMGNIDDQLMSQSSEYAYYNGLLSKARRDLSRLTKDLETLTANSAKNRRQELAQGGKKITDKSIELFVAALPEVDELKAQIIDLEYKHNLLKALVQALQHRKDCLIQLSANNRAEVQLNG